MTLTPEDHQPPAIASSPKDAPPEACDSGEAFDVDRETVTFRSRADEPAVPPQIVEAEPVLLAHHFGESGNVL